MDLIFTLPYQHGMGGIRKWFCLLRPREGDREVVAFGQIGGDDKVLVLSFDGDLAGKVVLKALDLHLLLEVFDDLGHLEEVSFDWSSAVKGNGSLSHRKKGTAIMPLFLQSKRVSSRAFPLYNFAKTSFLSI